MGASSASASAMESSGLSCFRQIMIVLSGFALMFLVLSHLFGHGLRHIHLCFHHFVYFACQMTILNYCFTTTCSYFAKFTMPLNLRYVIGHRCSHHFQNLLQHEGFHDVSRRQAYALDWHYRLQVHRLDLIVCLFRPRFGSDATAGSTYGSEVVPHFFR